MAVHVIPVPYGMTPDEALEEIQTMGYLVEYRWWSWRHHWPFRCWAAIEVPDLPDDTESC